MYNRTLPIQNSSRFLSKSAQINPDEFLNKLNYHPNLLQQPQPNHPSNYPNFLSHRSTKLLHSTYHSHLRAVAELAFGSTESSTQAQKELFRIVEAAERGEGRLKNPRLLHHASQAWNIDFFLRGLTLKETNPSDFVLKILSRDFGSFENFQRTFQAHASAMIGCGWIWLVKRDNNDGNMDSEIKDKDFFHKRESKLSILTTFNGASPLFKTCTPLRNNNTNNLSSTHISSVKNSPILGLNLWESAFVLDYGLDRDGYVRNWWKAINWNLASVLLTK